MSTQKVSTQMYAKNLKYFTKSVVVGKIKAAIILMAPMHHCLCLYPVTLSAAHGVKKINLIKQV
jgi:hypothetical protein